MKKYFLLLLISLFVAPSWATTNFPLTNAIGVAITPKGQEYFLTGLPAFLKANNYELENIYFPGTEVVGEETATEDLVDDPELREVIIKAKDILNRFFEGLELDTHRLSMGIEDIYVNANWDEVSLSIQAPTESEMKQNYTAIFVVRLRANNLKMKVTKVRASDLNNEWLGALGIDNFSLFSEEESAPLEIELALGFNQLERGNFQINVLTPSTNLDELLLGYTFDSPLVLPEVEVQINEKKLRLRNEEIEALLLEEQDNILERVKVVLQEKLETELPSQMTEMINTALDEGLKEVNQMDPPGAPNKDVSKFVWALALQEINYADGHLLLDLDARFDDPVEGTGEVLVEKYNSSIPANLTKGSYPDADFVFSLNEGVLNRVIQLSSLRGYFDSIETDGGETIKLAKIPYLTLKEETGKMGLEIEYKVTGLQALAVKNPIHIEFDLNLAFPIDSEGKATMVVESIDVDSASVDKKYIRFFASKVRKAVKEKLSEVNEDMKGYVLADEIPIPDDLGGIALQKLATEVDNNGHLLIYSEYAN